MNSFTSFCRTINAHTYYLVSTVDGIIFLSSCVLAFGCVQSVHCIGRNFFGMLVDIYQHWHTASSKFEHIQESNIYPAGSAQQSCKLKHSMVQGVIGRTRSVVRFIGFEFRITSKSGL